MRTTPRPAGAVDRRTYRADARGWLDYRDVVPGIDRLDGLVHEERWRWRGLSVHIDRLPAPGAGAKLLLVHGVGGYGRLVIGPFGLPAHDAGCEVVAVDLPGYGLTDVPDRDLTFGLWVDCLVDLIRTEQETDPRPLVLMGLSLGGVTAYHAAARSDGVSRLVATTLLDPRDPDVMAGISRWPLAGRIGVPVMRTLRWLTDWIRPPVALMAKMDAIANDPDLAALCVHDPLGGATRLPLRFFRTLTQLAPTVEPEQFDLPVLVLHPAQDRMTDIGLTRRFVSRFGDNAALIELPGCGHFPIEEPGARLLHEHLDVVLRTAAR
jgi:pimeloyl-ACP methyl ester carboxylesterase